MEEGKCTHPRAAGGYLNWSVRDRVDRAGVHRNTSTNVETGNLEASLSTLAAL